MVVCVVLGGVYSLIVSPTYKIETLLAPEDSSSSSQILSQLGSQLGAFGLGRFQGREQGSQGNVSIAILQSRKFLGEFIARYNLLPEFFASRWDKEAAQWIDNGDPQPTINDGFRKLTRGILMVEKHELTGFVTVSMQWKNAEQAHQWLMRLIADLNEDIRQRERDEATRSLQFLTDELTRTGLMDVQQVLHQLSLVELHKLTLANVREEFAFKIIDPPNLPDIDDPIWPKPVLILLGSAFFGLFFGVALAVVQTAWRAAFKLN